MRAYIIPLSDFGYGPEPDEVIAMRLETVVSAMLDQFGLQGRAEWYYDEFVDPIEHGVKIDIQGVTAEQFIHIINDVKTGCLQHCDAVEVEIG